MTLATDVYFVDICIGRPQTRTRQRDDACLELISVNELETCNGEMGMHQHAVQVR